MSVVGITSGLKPAIALVAAAVLCGCVQHTPTARRPLLAAALAQPAAAPLAARAADNGAILATATPAPAITSAIGGPPARQTQTIIPPLVTRGEVIEPLLKELPQERALPTPPDDGAAAKRSGRLADILRHALADNPDIGIAAAQIEDERYAVEVARAGLHPTVNLRAAQGMENYEIDGSANPQTGVQRREFGIDLHQTIYDFGRSSYSIARRKALLNSAGYRHLAKLNAIALEVAGAYLRIIEADEQARIAEGNVASHEDIHQLVEAQHKAGNASIADVKRVTTRLEKARTGLIDLRSRRQSAREDFIRVAGFEPGSLAPPPQLPAPLPPAGISSDDYPDSPDLMSVRADIDSLRMQAGVAKANLAPSIDLDVTGGVKDNTAGETDETSTFKGMISFNYKLMDGDARLNTARQIYARIDESKQRYRKKRRDYVSGLDSAIRTVRTNGQKAASLRTRAADSRKVLELYKAQFKDGNKTLFELLDAQMDLFQAESENIANRYQLLQSIYEIHGLRGDLVARLLDH